MKSLSELLLFSLMITVLGVSGAFAKTVTIKELCNQIGAESSKDEDQAWVRYNHPDVFEKESTFLKEVHSVLSKATTDGWVHSYFPDQTLKIFDQDKKNEILNFLRNFSRKIEDYRVHVTDEQYQVQAKQCAVESVDLLKNSIASRAFGISSWAAKKGTFLAKEELNCPECDVSVTESVQTMDAFMSKHEKDIRRLTEPCLLGVERKFRGQGALTLPSVMIEFLSDPVYYQVIPIAVELLAYKIERAQLYGEIPGNFFSDVLAAFLSVGLTEEDARERTWKIMGLYGTQGTMVHVFLNHATNFNAPLVLGLGLLVNEMQYLDGFRSDDRQYSFPLEVKSTCAIGKPYHFWLAAYLARSLVKDRKINPRVAALGVHFTGTLYEFGSHTNNRNFERLMEGSLVSPYKNMLRMGIAFKTAGAIYGAWDGQLSDFLDVDLAIKKIFASRQSSWLFNSGLGSTGFPLFAPLYYEEFKKMIAPHSTLEVYPEYLAAPSKN